jgi:hypothetical protein
VKLRATLIAAVTLVALVAAPATWASEPTGYDSNSRAVFVACGDDYAGVADCLTLAEALQLAADNGTSDDLILLKPGKYCPVNLPNTGSRLYLQGISQRAVLPITGTDPTSYVFNPQRSEVEEVVFTTYAKDTNCDTAYDGTVLRAAVSSNLIFLSNLAVDGANKFVSPTSNAHYGIWIDQASAYLRDVVVRGAQTGIKIRGGEISHSAVVKNTGNGIETSQGGSTWIQDTLVADNGGAGIYDSKTGSFATYPNTLVNVTVIDNAVGLATPPGYYNYYASVRNSVIAVNAVDCSSSYIGYYGLSSYNAVGSGCESLTGATGTVVMTDGSYGPIGAVQYQGGFEPYATLSWGSDIYKGDPNACTATDQLEQARHDCYMGAYGPAVVSPVGSGTDLISNHVSFPSSLDFAPVQPGDSTSAAAYLSNPDQGFVTVRDVSVTEGFTVIRDDCSLSFMPRTWIGVSGNAAQAYCSIMVEATPTADMTGTLTVTTNHGTVTIPLSAPLAPPPVTSSKPTISGTVKVGSKVTAVPGSWTAGAALTYRWLRNGVAISGATASTYTPTSTDRGKTLSVSVTGSAAGYTDVTQTSAGKVVAYGTLTTTTPKITGTVKVGKTLTAVPGTWKAGSKSATLTYQWYAGGKKISGATKKTYKLKSAQKGKKITVSVKGSATGYTSVTKTSKATAKVT